MFYFLLDVAKYLKRAKSLTDTLEGLLKSAEHQLQQQTSSSKPPGIPAPQLVVLSAPTSEGSPNPLPSPLEDPHPQPQPQPQAAAAAPVTHVSPAPACPTVPLVGLVLPNRESASRGQLRCSAADPGITISSYIMNCACYGIFVFLSV